MNWTKEQLSAIETDGCNLLISAAAGSGKTAVLTERIARLVKEGANMDRFLIVTFTEAATSEMKRRIAARLYRAAEEAGDKGDAPEAQRLREQAMLTGSANISTLHAFCLYILKRNFHILGLDPAFRTADELLGGMLREQAMEECAKKRYEAEDVGFLGLLRALGGSEEALFETVRKLYEFIMAQPEPFPWLEEALSAYGLPEEGVKNHPAMAGYLFRCMQSGLAQEVALLRAREATPDEKQKVQQVLDEDLAQVRALALAKSIEELRERLHALQFARFPVWGKGFEKEKELVQGLRNEARKKLNDMKGELSRSMGEEAEALRLLHPYMETLCNFVEEYHAIYGAMKAERGVVDFSDMEHLTLQALSHETVRTALQRRFQYIFVDEYQDSSRIQERILEAVRRENNLFLVGDVKQSIYRFRQADPGLFLEKMRRYESGAMHEDAPGGRLIRLNHNFRSARPVIEAVNNVFSHIMSAAVGEMEYDESAALRLPEPSGSEPPGSEESISSLDGVELHVIAKKRKEAENPENGGEEAPDGEDTGGEAHEQEEAPREDVEDAQAEAMLAAERIRTLMEHELFFDKRLGRERPLRYGDFTVLLRAQRPVAQAWAQSLAAMGIPAYVQLTGGYFDAVEVQVFLNILKVIDNSRQDIPLLSALRSPVFGFTLEELAEARVEYPADTLYGCLKLCAGQEGDLPQKIQGAFAQLEAWEQEQRLEPLPDFMARLLDETGFYDCVGALPAGRERQANLDALLLRAEEYGALGGPNDLSGFLSYMDTAAGNARLGTAQAGAADVVRVLSMHGAKGLEYPVVFLAGLGRSFAFRTMERREPLLYLRELGLGAKLIVDGVRRDTLYRKAILEESIHRQLAEEMRILYVGMTRAKSRLILMGCAEKAKETLERGKEALSPALCGEAKCYLDWLLPVAGVCKLPYSLHLREEYMMGAQGEAEEACPNEVQAAPPELLESIKAHFEWRYPHGGAVDTPTKRSVSDLVRLHERILSEAPEFARAAGDVSGAERGTAVHTVLRELRLFACGEGAELQFVREEIKRLAESGVLSQRQAEAVAPEDVAWYLKTGLGRRMRMATRMERELDFALELPAKEVLRLERGEIMEEEPVLLQGVIDGCFLEEDGWVLLDFKTDRKRYGVPPETAAEEHKEQLILYAEALAKLTGKPVKEKFVVLLGYQEIVEV